MDEDVFTVGMLVGGFLALVVTFTLLIATGVL